MSIEKVEYGFPQMQNFKNINERLFVLQFLCWHKYKGLIGINY